MANYYVGINRGAGLTGCAINTSSTGKDMEVFINGTNIPSKNDVLILMQVLEAFIVQQGWPPM